MNQVLLQAQVFQKRLWKLFPEVLKVDVVATTIAGQDVVGSLGDTNDQGILLHPDVTPEEVMLVEQVMRVFQWLVLLVLASICWQVFVLLHDTAGSETTGPEMNRIEDALGLI